MLGGACLLGIGFQLWLNSPFKGSKLDAMELGRERQLPIGQRIHQRDWGHFWGGKGNGYGFRAFDATRGRSNLWMPTWPTLPWPDGWNPRVRQSAHHLWWFLGWCEHPHPIEHCWKNRSSNSNGCVQALHWLHAAKATPPAPAQGGDKGGPPAWSPPGPTQAWTLFKADITKAHGRIKVLPTDWRFQIAQLGERSWWINKVGTYGVASAQLYWGRMAAFLLRITYLIFHEVDWGFVFVDDFCWILRTESANLWATTILATYLALGVPLSWKKRVLSEVNTWLGLWWTLGLWSSGWPKTNMTLSWKSWRSSPKEKLSHPRLLRKPLEESTGPLAFALSPDHSFSHSGPGRQPRL